MNILSKILIALSGFFKSAESQSTTETQKRKYRILTEHERTSIKELYKSVMVLDGGNVDDYIYDHLSCGQDFYDYVQDTTDFDIGRTSMYRLINEAKEEIAEATTNPALPGLEEYAHDSTVAA